MIAGVILNNSSHNVDREFDYEIPAKFIGEVSVGTRVLVPFGRGNAAAEGERISEAQINLLRG